MSNSDKLPFSVEISRMIELLAAQIYPSPYALLRENTQNSFDAIVLRRHLGQNFEPAIEINIGQDHVQVTDNGIGMSRADLSNHYWRAGSSSKNTSEARAAGVVGTFGIGAMANFGIADALEVETESAITGERTWCKAERETLSVTEDCIDTRSLEPTGVPGTRVTARMKAGHSIPVEQAKTYITAFVAHLSIPVRVNGQLVSQQPLDAAVPGIAETWRTESGRTAIGGNLVAAVILTGSAAGELRVDLSNMEFRGQPVGGRMILRQGVGQLRTFRSGFGLATTSPQSVYGFGGVADFAFLAPTAGREALTTESMQVLQQFISEIDDFVSLNLAGRPESNTSTGFMNWVLRRGRYELCGHLLVRVEPGGPISLAKVQARSQSQPVLVYGGNDAAVIEHASDERPLIVLARTNPRRQCENNFLRQHCAIEELTDQPRVLEPKPNAHLSMAESGTAFRVASIVSSDYFVEAAVHFGKLSHGLPVLVTSQGPPVDIWLNPDGSNVRLLLDLYEKEYSAFGHMAKDFVRNVVFPKISRLVPSATRQGAEAFLKLVQRKREVFEYEMEDLESLTALWQDYLSGKVTMQEATRKARTVARRSFQTLDGAAAAPVRDVIPDVIDNEATLGQVADAADAAHEPAPPIQRLDIETPRKLLTIEDHEPALKGYRCFLALTDRVRREKGDFFLQPHRTSIVWAGQKALFIFQHHSGEFGLYYDVQTPDLVGQTAGGGSFETCTIVMKNRVFVPIPEQIQVSFLPGPSERKRLEIRCDILHIDGH